MIGKGGSVIRAMTEETGATIDLDNDGTVKIASVDGASGREARRRIDLITADVEVGRIYDGKVVRLMDFGAFVTILPGKDGLVHISQIAKERVEKVTDYLSKIIFLICFFHQGKDNQGIQILLHPIFLQYAGTSLLFLF